MQTLLDIQTITAGYGNNIVVNDLSFHVNAGQIICLLGPSGCGKTTILRAIAGFEKIRSGKIILAAKEIASVHHILPPEKRGIGMVFQENSLFPHLTVRQNICFGLIKHTKAEQDYILDEMLELVKLQGLVDRYPHELSGGQQQRVALARSLAPKPKVLLLDEPFSSLDIELRRSLCIEIRDILTAQKITAILVTHDQEEAFAFADQIGVLNKGRLEQWDTPYNLYHEPVNRFVADFIGQGHFIRGYVIEPDTIETEIGHIKGNRAYDWVKGTPVDVLIRPDDIIHNQKNDLTAEVVKKSFTGPATLYTLRLPTGSLVASLFPSHYDYTIGEQVGIELEADHLVAFHAPTE